MKKMFWLEEGLQYSMEEIGNKAFLLAKLKNDNVNVPKTFVISDQVFKEFLVYNKLLGKIYLNLYDIVKTKYNVSYSETYMIAELQNKLNIIQKMVYSANFDEDTSNDIKYFYESMNSRKTTDEILNSKSNNLEVALKLSLNDNRSSKELGYANYIDINSLESLYLHIKASFAEFFTTKFFVNMMRKYDFIDLFKKEIRVDEVSFKNKFIELIEKVKYNIIVQERKNASKSGFIITNTSKKIYDNSLYLINDGDFTKNFSDHYSRLYKLQNLDVAPMQYYLVNINNSIIFGNYGYNLTSSEIRDVLKNKHRLLEEIHSDRYIVDNNLMEVVYRDIRRQEKKVVFIDSRFDTESVEMNSQNDQKLNDKELIEISRIYRKLDGIFLVDYLFENNMLYVLNVDLLEDIIGSCEGNIKDLARKTIAEIFDTNNLNENQNRNINYGNQENQFKSSMITNENQINQENHANNFNNSQVEDTNVSDFEREFMKKFEERKTSFDNINNQNFENNSNKNEFDIFNSNDKEKELNTERKENFDNFNFSFDNFTQEKKENIEREYDVFNQNFNKNFNQNLNQNINQNTNENSNEFNIVFNDLQKENNFSVDFSNSNNAFNNEFDLTSGNNKKENNDFFKNMDFGSENLVNEENYSKTLNELNSQNYNKSFENNQREDYNKGNLNNFNNDFLFEKNNEQNNERNNDFIFNDNVFNNFENDRNKLVENNFSQRNDLNQSVTKEVIGNEIKKYLEAHSNDYEDMDSRSLDKLINNNLKEILMYLYLKKSKENPQVKDQVLKNIIDNYDDLKQNKKKLLDYLKVFFN